MGNLKAASVDIFCSLDVVARVMPGPHYGVMQPACRLHAACMQAACSLRTIVDDRILNVDAGMQGVDALHPGDVRGCGFKNMNIHENWPTCHVSTCLSAQVVVILYCSEWI